MRPANTLRATTGGTSPDSRLLLTYRLPAAASASGISPEMALWLTSTTAHGGAGCAAGAGAVYATCGSADKCAFAERELGAARAFDYKEDPAWDQALLKATGGAGADLIVDFVGADYFARNLAAAARGARTAGSGTRPCPTCRR